MPERAAPDRELHIRGIGLAAAAIAATVLAVVIAVLLWLHERGQPPGGTRLARDYDLVIPGPALQSAPQPELKTYLAQKKQQLGSIGWVDASQGLAHIPIDDAMALLAARAASAAEGQR